MHPILMSVCSWLALPLYVVQGLWVRKHSLRLPPAKGKRSGVYGEGEPVYRILAIGDSSAAGAGVAKVEDTIGPQFCRQLHTKTGAGVAWHMSGHNSAVAGQIRDLVVPNLEPVDYTHILIMIGTNDMKNMHTGSRWKKEFGGLLYALRTRFPESKIYWHQAVDMSKTPALPKLLATTLNWRRELLNKKGAQLCDERGAVAIPPLPVVDAAGFCRDGFHANEDGYEAWAAHLLEHVDLNT